MNLRQAPDGSFFLPKPDPEAEARLDKMYQRIPGELRWIPKKNLAQKVLSLASAVTSRHVSEETFQQRLAICKECPCLKKDEEKLYCGCCGCGQNRLSELHRKLKLSRAKCPLKMF